MDIGGRVQNGQYLLPTITKVTSHGSNTRGTSE
jgi:hypothetical protein